MTFQLRPPRTAEDWAAWHDIRKRVLFIARGKGEAYDSAHPDDRKPDNHPLLFEVDGQAVGAVRIDLDLPDAWLRRMAVDSPFQRNGHGRRMIGEIVVFCRKAGALRILSAVAPDAVGFYGKCGFDSVPDSLAGEAVRMQLDLFPI